MDQPPAEYINTAYSSNVKGLAIPSTPIEVTIETDDISLTVRGCDGQQVHDTLQTTFRSLKKPWFSAGDDALLVGFSIALVVGLLIIVGSAFYSLGQGQKPTLSPISKSL